MGLFTYLVIPDKFLPEKYKGKNNWQTYGIVSPIMGTITVDEKGNMKYEFDTTFIGGSGENKFSENLKYGDFDVKICSSNDENPNSSKWKLISAKAKIRKGKLISISKLVEE